jgi:hypothetical protein
MVVLLLRGAKQAMCGFSKSNDRGVLLGLTPELALEGQVPAHPDISTLSY